MHPAIFTAFDRLCRQYGQAGAVLEIGATPTADTLLNLPSLAATTTRVGVNLEGDSHTGSIAIHAANGHDLSMFTSGSFDMVLCNSTFEHDPEFWLTLAEARRVLRPGGVAIYGVPGYVEHRGPLPRVRWLLSQLWPAPLPGSTFLAGAAASTPTLQVHNYPGDFYRFSAQAMRETLLSGFDILAIETHLHPPRIIGVGRRHG